MALFECTMCGEELDLIGAAIIRIIHKPYHEREEIVNNAYINSRLCGPMERVYTNKHKGQGNA